MVCTSIHKELKIRFGLRVGIVVAASIQSNRVLNTVNCSRTPLAARPPGPDYSLARSVSKGTNVSYWRLAAESLAQIHLILSDDPALAEILVGHVEDSVFMIRG